ncbi:transmembrane protein, putative [Medicago truncatula]|uniref:Transmembrane protein, putative n=1 Tax=Medicago truncatula TaxID=3880 RepID=G7IA44_MEDTR|nr:transmembrane protein, putative [Medicago truncatula]
MGSKWDIEKFTGDNDFGLWKVRMEAVLIQQKCEKTLKGEGALPVTISREEKTEMLDKLPKNPTFQPGWDLEEIHATFFKCISWQMQETKDTINCPYHYVCDKTYPPNYHLSIDILGNQINTIFPLSCIGPAILLLVLISALSFDNEADYKDIQYTFFAASTVSGILHASLYLDSIALAYYTGFDALMSSTLSGECATCVCRKEALAVGGKLVKYKGWSMTTFFVGSVLCLRIICTIFGENVGKFVSMIKVLMERFSWILISLDCVYLIAKSPPERVMLRVVAFGCIFLLIVLHVLKEACSQIHAMAYVAEKLRLVSMSTPIA